MKFTTTTILAAALATLSSAAAVPSTLQPLPDKFTLVFTTKDSVLSKISPNITIDIAFGDVLYMGPNTNEEQIHVEFVKTATGASTTAGDHRFPYPLIISTSSQVLIGDNPTITAQSGSYGQINGAFGFSASDGHGPATALWAACPAGLPVNLWTLHWNRPDCVQIGVNVVAV